MPIYLVDSNFFIQAHRATYPLDVATSFWRKIKELAESGIIASIDKVRMELYDKNDELETWCKANLPSTFFRDSSTALSQYGEISRWAQTKLNNPYFQRAIQEFLDVNEADAFLIAYALEDITNRIIVTQEVSSPHSKTKVKIPEPCEAFDIRWLNMVEMFREIRTTF